MLVCRPSLFLITGYKTLTIWVFPKIGVFPPKWIVKIMENRIFFNGWFGGKTHYFRKHPYKTHLLGGWFNQGLSDTLLGHPGRGGSPAACPELTTARTRKSHDNFAAAEGWMVFFMRLFKKQLNISYQTLTVDWFYITMQCFFKYIYIYFFCIRFTIDHNQWDVVVFSDFEGGIRNESRRNACRANHIKPLLSSLDKTWT